VPEECHYDRGVVPEAKLTETEAGLVAASPGWFLTAQWLPRFQPK
jgi:hypothetical protein